MDVKRVSIVIGIVALTTLATKMLLEKRASVMTSSRAGESSPDPSIPDPAILVNLRTHGFVHLADRNLKAMTSEEQTLTLHSVLDNTDTVCKRKLRMGSVGDGGWEICDDEDVRPRQPCVVYSFGIANEFSFDDDTAATYGCHVYSFDPSMKDDTHNRSERVHFYKVGIAGKTETRKNGWRMFTFSDIRGLLRHQRTRIEVVKMDVEWSEWEVLKEMSASGELQRIKQLLIEFHGFHRLTLEVIQLLEREGFRKFYVHKNDAKANVLKVKGVPGVRTACYEVHYVRRPSS